MRQPGPRMNPSTATSNDINYLFCKRSRLCKYLWFKGNDGERSFIRNVFPNLAWILITVVILFPQNTNMRPLEGTDLTPRKPTQTGMSGPGRSVAKPRILLLEEHPLLRDGIADCFD